MPPASSPSPIWKTFARRIPQTPPYPSPAAFSSPHRQPVLFFVVAPAHNAEFALKNSDRKGALMYHRRFILPKMAAAPPIPFLSTACAAKPQNPSFPVTFSQAETAIDQMRADPHPLSRPLVIIGGFA